MAAPKQPSPKDVLENPTLAPTQRGLTAFKPSELPDWLTSTGSGLFLTTLDTTTDKGFAMALKASIAKDRALINEVNLDLYITDWFISKWFGENEETGQIEEGVRIGIIDREGLVHVTYSFGVRQCLVLMMQRFGRGTWNPPVHVKVCSMAVRKGRMLYLELVGG